jgi:hypothetical protein
MDPVSYCPYRTNLDWSTSQRTRIQTTKVTQPLLFNGTPDDLRLLAACIQQPEEPEKPTDDAPAPAGKLLLL